jgi:predicted outer membrane repeat protein
MGVTAAQLKLSPMRDHGGDTMTMLPHKTSVAVDRGFNFPDDGGYTIPFDQRGRGRPYNDPNVPDALTGDSTDVGAVELGPPQTSSTRTVTTVSGHDDDSCTIDDCTFAEAVDAANAAPDADTIVFDQALTGGIRIDPALTDGLVISSPVTIRVNSLNTLFINPGYQRAFTVTGGPVRMENLAIRWAAPPKDGAIYNSGDLTMVDCQVTGASLGFGSRGAGAFNAAGGKLVLQNCTFAYNKAYGEGGAIYNDGGLLNATNCTFSDNVADRGAGIFNAAAATGRISLLNCTLSGNHADGGEPLGNGVYNASGSDAVHVANTIIATDNSFYPDVVGPVVSKGHNLIGNGQSSTGFTNGLNGDQIGTSNFPKWPSLNPLAKNGGQTLTRALRDDSLAINAGNVALAPYTDQRGYQRSEKTDVGAFEWQPPDIPPSPTPTPPPGTTPTPPPSPPPSPHRHSTPTPTPTGSPRRRLRLPTHTSETWPRGSASGQEKTCSSAGSS